MGKTWLFVFIGIVLLFVLYLIEMSKVKTDNRSNMPTLDDLQTDEISKNWDLFYKVRADITDGQSAIFSISDELKMKEGSDLRLSGAMVFRGNGCELLDSLRTRVNYFFLLPTLSLARACALQPEEAMRWTIRVNLAKPMIMDRSEMINAEAIVTGRFLIDTSKPYEAAFILENANAELIPEHD